MCSLVLRFICIYIDVKVATTYRKERNETERLSERASEHKKSTKHITRVHIPNGSKQWYSQQLVGEFEGDQICFASHMQICFVSSAISIRFDIVWQHLRIEARIKKYRNDRTKRKIFDQD